MGRDRLSIVHVTTFYPPHNFGGDGVHVQRLAGALARRGHEVSVIHAPGAYSLLSPARHANRAFVGDAGAPDGPVTLHGLGGWRGAIEPFLVQQTGRPVLDRGRLERLLAGTPGRGPDVIHYHNVSLVGGMGVLGLGRALKLYTAHEYWLVCPTHLLFRYNREICRDRTCVRCTLKSGRPPQLWRTRRMLERSVAQIDAMIYPSRLTQSVYDAHGVRRPGHVLYHFLPDEYIAAAAARGRRRHDADAYFLYVGRMAPVKGVEPLVRHFAERPTPAPLWLAGDGPLEGSLRRAYEGHPRVRFIGRKSQQELGHLYRDAMALILPSTGYEIYGQVVLEAFAHATPAIVTDVAGASELVEQSGGGRVYGSDEALDEALQALAGDVSLRDALGRQGQDHVRLEHGESHYVDRYESLIGNLRRAGPAR
jgi:glycosyltransferase involved in cell wall biosynthesis